MFFRKGIEPFWEDKQNEAGSIIYFENKDSKREQMDDIW